MARGGSAARRPSRCFGGALLLAALAVTSACGGGNPAPVALGPRLVAPLPAFAGLGVPVQAVAGHRFVRPVRIDGGALSIEPPGSATAGVALPRAERLVMVAMVNQQSVFNPRLVALGRVSLSAVAGPGGLPAYRRRLAWVGFIVPGPAGLSCSGVGEAGSRDAPSFGAVLLDAGSAAAALVYRSRGTGPCGGIPVGPSVNRAYEVGSVPWTLGPEVAAPAPPVPPPPGSPLPARPASRERLIFYTMPPCGSDWDAVTTYRGRAPWAFSVEVQRPIEPPLHCGGPRRATGVLPQLAPLRHGPTGVVVGDTVLGQYRP